MTNATPQTTPPPQTAETNRVGTVTTVELVVRKGGTRHGLYAKGGKPFLFTFDYAESDGAPADAALRAYVKKMWGDAGTPRGTSIELVRFVEGAK